MQVPFTHPLATHSPLDVLGYRRNGQPIYAIAGGSDGGDGGSGSIGSGASADAGQGTPPAGQQSTDQGGQQSGSESGSSGDSTDWKALARQWEKRAKDNKTAADELAALKAAQMTEQEKAVTEAEQRGRTAAAREYGAQLATARFEAAAAAAGVQLGDAADLIDTSRFLGENGTVDTDAIQAAVTKLAALAPRGAGRSGGDMGGAGGSGDTATSLDKEIAQAKANGDWRRAMQLENRKLIALAADQQ